MNIFSLKYFNYLIFKAYFDYLHIIIHKIYILILIFINFYSEFLLSWL